MGEPSGNGATVAVQRNPEGKKNVRAWRWVGCRSPTRTSHLIGGWWKWEMFKPLLGDWREVEESFARGVEVNLNVYFEIT